MFLEGFLYKYDKKNNLIAFTNKKHSQLNIILIGGLDHNILSLPYTSPLLKFCNDENVRLIIPQFRSHPNYSIHPVDNDIEDLKVLLDTVDGDIILIGNSTGCQDILLYCNEYNNMNIKMCILQGPVSDTEYEESLGVKYNNQQKDPFLYNNRIYIEDRFSSLFIRDGKEDLFSSYKEDTHYRNLNKNKYDLMFVISKKDEYIINSIDHKLKLVENSQVYILEDGDHFLTDKKSQDEFFNLLRSSIKRVI
ncbi:hypothetical protein P3W45_001224 [Vairimorpha bombi]